MLFRSFVYLACLGSYYTFYLISRFQLSVQSAQLHLFLFLGATAVGTIAGGLLGGSRMQYHLRQCLTSVDCFLFGKPEVIVNMGVSKFDAATGALKDQAAADLVKQQMEAFGKFIARVKD